MAGTSSVGVSLLKHEEQPLTTRPLCNLLTSSLNHLRVLLRMATPADPFGRLVAATGDVLRVPPDGHVATPFSVDPDDDALFGQTSLCFPRRPRDLEKKGPPSFLLFFSFWFPRDNVLLSVYNRELD